MTAGEVVPAERCSSNLVALAVSLRQTSKSAPDISTQVQRDTEFTEVFMDCLWLWADCICGLQDFASCCEQMLPFFDHLGPVFHVARSEVSA